MGWKAQWIRNYVNKKIFEYILTNISYGSLMRIIENSNLNTQNMKNPTIVSPVKMEYVWNFSISGLKMMVKSGLEKIFFKFLHALPIFY